MHLRLLTVAIFLTVLTSAVGVAQASTAQQDFFTAALQKDKKVTKTVKSTLTSGVAFVDPTNLFADVTGDGKADAIVFVESGSVNGALALYVFTTDGGKSDQLRVVYRSQTLQRATARVSGTALVIRQPIWGAGDDPCCALKYRLATYRWNAKHKTMERTAVREVAAGVPGA